VTPVHFLVVDCQAFSFQYIFEKDERHLEIIQVWDTVAVLFPQWGGNWYRSFEYFNATAEKRGFYNIYLKTYLVFISWYLAFSIQSYQFIALEPILLYNLKFSH
jgi:hypothetical protein